MYSLKKFKNKKRDHKMNVDRTQRKFSDYLIFLLMIAVISQLVLLIYRIVLL
jgi:hypothetical protein